MRVWYHRWRWLWRAPGESRRSRELGGRVLGSQRWVELAFPDADTALHLIHRADDVPSIEPVLVLVTDDVEGMVQALRDRGVPTLTEPAESSFQPGRTAAAFQDSEGNQMALVSQ